MKRSQGYVVLLKGWMGEKVVAHVVSRTRAERIVRDIRLAEEEARSMKASTYYKKKKK